MIQVIYIISNELHINCGNVFKNGIGLTHVSYKYLWKVWVGMGVLFTIKVLYLFTNKRPITRASIALINIMDVMYRILRLTWHIDAEA